MPEFSLVTINILNDLSRWNRRRSLLINQLSEIDPDLIAIQEVSFEVEPSNAHWLAQELNQRQGEDNPYHVYLCPKTGRKREQEGIAILCRLPVRRHEILDLLSQHRVAQLVEFRIEDQAVMLVNGHFYWKPGPAPEREKQIELLLNWLDTQPAEIPVMVCGDFNGVPGTPEIELMRKYFDSAYRAIHGDEPEYTCPTPMPNSMRVRLHGLAGWLLGKRPRPDPAWKGTLDYIFVDPRLHAEECRVVLDQPAPDNSAIYPSDHYGLYALIKVSQ